jgi:GH35 family endo-1,4-beta-xylanase
MKQKYFNTFLGIIMFLSLNQLKAQTFNGTPPSCVITAPHHNSYFQHGKSVTINVYSTDIGGSSANGTVTKVEFFNGNTKLGEATSHVNNTFTYTWNCATTGTHIITAKATDNSNNVSTSAGVKITVGTDPAKAIGISAGKGKYLANIIAGSVPANYNTYWNGVTSENDCKWGTVEGNRNSMNWGGADRSYKHASDNYMMYRYHALAWGSQYPQWIKNLSRSDFEKEMLEYMDAVAARFPNIDQIDVLNEQIGTHAEGTNWFREGLGGNNGGIAPDNNTGYDWQIWLFRKARERFPNAKLVLNDYGLENDQNAIRTMLGLVKVLRDRNLIDGFGTQAHEFNINTLSANALKSSLDLMATSGVPIYVTELDISGNDSQQNSRYNTLLPVYWNHYAVGGITLWGYIVGQTWKDNTGLVSSGAANASERPAMQTIKSFINGLPNVNYPFGTITPTTCISNDPPTISITAPENNAKLAVNTNITISATAEDTDGTVTKVEFYNGSTKLGESTSSPYSYTWNNVTEGEYSLSAYATDNSGNVAISNSVTILVGNPVKNLISNGELNDGTSNWNLQLNNSTQGTMTVVTNANMSGPNAMKICPTSAGDANWNVQVSQTVGITQGKQYVITYMAKADVARAMATAIQEAGDPYTIYTSETVDLTTTEQEFSHQFIADDTDATALLKFFVGTNTSCVYIDNIAMKELIVTGNLSNTVSKVDIKVFPNPFKEDFSIDTKGNFEYTITDLHGKVVEKGSNSGNSKSIGRDLTKGMYLIQIKGEEGINTFKVTKN